MADIKYTKNELMRLQNKQQQLEQYLPTLKLKKMLLQVEVAKAEDAIQRLLDDYTKEKEEIRRHAAVIKDPFGLRFTEHLVIKDIQLTYENIAGIELPYLKSVIFQECDDPLYLQPIWMDAMIVKARSLSTAFQRVKVAEDKKAILQNELRKISIRVNLFEKRLIPEIESDMNKIRVFLGDLDLQAVGKAKVAKNKLLKEKALIV